MNGTNVVVVTPHGPPPAPPVPPSAAAAPRPSGSFLATALQAGTLVTVIGIAWAGGIKLGTIEQKLDQQTKALAEQTLKLDSMGGELTKTHTSLLSKISDTRVETATIAGQMKKVDQWTSDISPKIIKEDFERKLAELEKTIAELRQRADAAASEAKKQVDATNLFMRGTDQKLAQLSGNAERFMSEVRNARLPSDIKPGFVKNAEALYREIESMRRRP